jgi:hypothetical protein
MRSHGYGLTGPVVLPSNAAIALGADVGRISVCRIFQAKDVRNALNEFERQGGRRRHGLESQLASSLLIFVGFLARSCAIALRYSVVQRHPGKRIVFCEAGDLGAPTRPIPNQTANLHGIGCLSLTSFLAASHPLFAVL